MDSANAARSRSTRHQIPIALTRALTHYKAQGMSLARIYIKLYTTSAAGKVKLHNDFGMLYTALSRATDPTNNVLIEKFPAEMLDAIANSPSMKAMLDEFKNMNINYQKTKTWAEPLLKEFDTMYEETIHCRHTTTTVITLPTAPEKVIHKMTQTSKAHNKAKRNASVRDYIDSRNKRNRSNDSKSSRPRKRIQGRRKRKYKRRRQRVTGAMGVPSDEPPGETLHWYW